MRGQAEFYKLSLRENIEVHKTVLKKRALVFEERSTDSLLLARCVRELRKYSRIQ